MNRKDWRWHWDSLVVKPARPPDPRQWCLGWDLWLMLMTLVAFKCSLLRLLPSFYSPFGRPMKSYAMQTTRVWGRAILGFCGWLGLCWCHLCLSAQATKLWGRKEACVCRGVCMHARHTDHARPFRTNNQSATHPFFSVIFISFVYFHLQPLGYLQDLGFF